MYIFSLHVLHEKNRITLQKITNAIRQPTLLELGIQFHNIERNWKITSELLQQKPKNIIVVKETTNSRVTSTYGGKYTPRSLLSYDEGAGGGAYVKILSNNLLFDI